MKIFLCSLLVLLSGCATVYDDSYWVKEYDALPVMAVIETNLTECGEMKESPFTNIQGCTYRFTDFGWAVIYIEQSLTPACKKCVLTHEENHALGYSHKTGATTLTRCGDGQLMLCS